MPKGLETVAEMHEMFAERLDEALRTLPQVKHLTGMIILPEKVSHKFELGKIVRNEPAMLAARHGDIRSPRSISGKRADRH